jgi:hypothetical protein
MAVNLSEDDMRCLVTLPSGKEIFFELENGYTREDLLIAQQIILMYLKAGGVQAKK